MTDVMNFHRPDRSGINYHSPATPEEAVAILAGAGGKADIIAGGTDLMIDIRDGKFTGEALVDVKGIAEMRELKEEGGRISIGAAVTIEELRQSALIRTKLPALARAADKFAGLQIRNQGTIGGNVGHAAPCGDTHPPIILYDGLAELATPNGRKTVDLGQTLAGPNRSALKEDELIVRFILTPQTAALADFQKIGRRKDLAISRVSLAMMIDKDSSGNINLAKVVLGACMPTTRRMPKTEAKLMGQKPSWDLFKEAAALMAAEMIEITGRRASIVYKEPAIQGLFLRIAMPLVKGD